MSNEHPITDQEDRLETLEGNPHPFDFVGSAGEGAGNRTWTYATQSISPVPARKEDIIVVLEGATMTEGIDYDYSTIAITFKYDVPDASRVKFVVFE